MNHGFSFTYLLPDSDSETSTELFFLLSKTCDILFIFGRIQSTLLKIGAAAKTE